MANLAFYSVGVLIAPVYKPEIASMGELLYPMWGVAEASDGFLGYAIEGGEIAGRDWGEFAIPSMFLEAGNAMRLLSVLSLWETLDAVYAFTYQGLHKKALSRRKEWFVAKDYPGFVAWWIDDDHTPTWKDACKRYETLCRDGASAEAFTFKQAYDSEGCLQTRK